MALIKDKKMTNTFLESFDLKSSKDRDLLEKAQQEPGISAPEENAAYANLSDKELLQAWREAECAKGAEAVDLRLEIIRRGLTPDQ
ncbi:hypothetical protein [Halomicronema sp. CCY15110]|uniref:hypothetical protein n=1 Tax=Halomicronema sp. CCY15110 TaxID=2767773 RepID=UPI0019507659|nr:hypothetical protein [Halomicronema sp. CCY15110]